MSIIEMFEVMDQAKEKQVPDKVTLIDAQLRFVREVDGSIEHVTWFIDVDRLTDFMQKHFTKQTC
ncbi:MULTISPECIES: hypothetical protein [unclassified Exiguobacterium]|uniref:hypothetical protein n=1 Tax=unclassified Exiguobacterium TaxID=2644629 RepID=UPI001BEABD0C|nr:MULTISPECIES: hypothetical protein [unclassified Exiguobacterium]